MHCYSFRTESPHGSFLRRINTEEGIMLLTAHGVPLDSTCLAFEPCRLGARKATAVQGNGLVNRIQIYANS